MGIGLKYGWRQGMSTPRKVQPPQGGSSRGAGIGCKATRKSGQESGIERVGPTPTHCVPTSEADADRVHRKTNTYLTSFHSLGTQGGGHAILK